MNPSLHIAVDVGGIFTDICIFTASTQKITVEKVPTTPSDSMKVMMDVIRRYGVILDWNT